MPKRKVAVALSGWLLEEVDAQASGAGVSRSSFVEEALAEYVVRRRGHEAESEYRRDALLALEDMRRFADEFDADPATSPEPTSLEKLRALRAEGRGMGA